MVVINMFYQYGFINMFYQYGFINMFYQYGFNKSVLPVRL